ncbi:hypothetical protein [Sphingobium phenoxybenzoativorans]|uniref:hypothetical protein n=1 Tax=Sphingobium phenoxybenzoativorans TaxID=1592790 RepID=UPI0008724E18|nr:hypothetical protein [Sphingobium phenoxybenzoativorans]
MTWLAPVALLAMTPLALAQADPAKAAAPQSLAGHYYLQGVMETGSELMLDPRGRFEWYLVYGALDLFAEGTWRQDGGTIVLTSKKAKGMPEPGFKTLTLTVRDADLIPPDGKGAYILAPAQ